MGSKTYWEFLWETGVLWRTEACWETTPEYKNFEEATKASAEALEGLNNGK